MYQPAAPAYLQSFTEDFTKRDVCRGKKEKKKKENKKGKISNNEIVLLVF